MIIGPSSMHRSAFGRSRTIYRGFAVFGLFLLAIIKLFLLPNFFEMQNVENTNNHDLVQPPLLLTQGHQSRSLLSSSSSSSSSPSSSSSSSSDKNNLQPIAAAAASSSFYNCSPQALSNFPTDLFTNRQRQHGAVILHIFLALYMFLGLAIACDEFFVPSLEGVCNTLQLQPDVAGATFMAAGSSAPELATTVIGVFIAKDDIGLGAVVGSADYNIMFVISMCALCARTIIHLNWWPLVRDCSVYCLSIIVLALIIQDEIVTWYEASILLILYGLYVCLMVKNRQVEKYFLDKFPNFGGEGNNNAGPTVGVSFPHVGGPSHMPSLHSGGIEGQESVRYGSNKLDSNTYQPFSNYEDNLTDIVDEYDVKHAAAPYDSEPTAPPSAVAEGTFLTLLQWPEPIDENSFASESLFASCISATTYYKLARLLHGFCLPLKGVLCVTVPDCRLPAWKRWFWLTFIMSCVWIGLFAYVMIWMITVIGHTLGIPDTVMGLTFIAAGSSVPDAIASVLVVREGQGDMAVSNAVGSNVFDILICMGIPWFFKTISSGPVYIYSRGLLYATMTLLSTVFILLVSTHLNRWRLTKPYGLFLMLIYVAYLILCTLYEMNLFGDVHLPNCPFND